MRSIRAFCLDFPYMGQERGTLNIKINLEYMAVTDVWVTCKPNGVSGNYCTVTIDSVVWRLAVGSIERNCCGYRFEVSSRCVWHLRLMRLYIHLLLQCMKFKYPFDLEIPFLCIPLTLLIRIRMVLALRLVGVMTRHLDL